MAKMKWYLKIILLYFFMLILNFLFIGSEFGISGNLLSALILTAIFSPMLFIDFTSKKSKAKKTEK